MTSEASRYSHFAMPALCQLSLRDYLELVDWTGRAARTDKRGAIDARLPPIMHRLNIDAAAWRDAMRPNGNVFGRALGQLESHAASCTGARLIVDTGRTPGWSFVRRRLAVTRA